AVRVVGQSNVNDALGRLRLPRPGERLRPAKEVASCHPLPGVLLGEDDGVENRSEEHTSELQSLTNLVCRLLLQKKKKPPAQPPWCPATIPNTKERAVESLDCLWR